MSRFQKMARADNALTIPVLRLHGINKVAAKTITTLTYTGRRSGREISLAVAYRRRDD